MLLPYLLKYTFMLLNLINKTIYYLCFFTITACLITVPTSVLTFFSSKIESEEIITALVVLGSVFLFVKY